MQPQDPAPPLQLAWGPLLQAHPLAHFVYDVQTLQLLAVNDAALARYGYSREAFLALNRADLLMPGQPEALRSFLDELPASATAEQQPVWLERTRDGRVLHADVRGMPVLFEGRVARLAAVVDATVREQLAAHAAVQPPAAADAAGVRDLLQVAGRMALLGGWSVDLQTRRARWSDVVCAIHEVPAGTEYDLDAALRFYPGPALASMRAAMSACAAGIPFDLELPFVGAQGTARWVRIVGAPVRDADGRIVAVEGAQQDITERKRDALALAESRARLAALLDAIPDLWFVIDADFRYAEVSNPQHPALSTPWTDKKGQRIDDALDATHAAEMRALIAAAHSTGQPQRYVYEMRTAQGDVRAYEGRCVPLSGGRTLKLIRDITDLAELERRFRAMADAAPVGIFMTDAVGACTYANAAWQRLYGLGAEAALGNGWVAVLHPEDRPLVQRHWLSMAAAGRPFKLEFRIRLPDGAERRLSSRSSPLRRADGEVFGHVGTVVDVTQAREYEALRRAQAVAEETGRRQAAFMSRVSHELRTPLNAILGFGQLLQQAPDLPPQRTQAYAGHVVQAGEHMLALVDDLLELQRLEQGRVQLKKAPVDLSALLSTCADLLGPVASAAQVELVVVAPPGLLVDSDERCLRQMVLNLGSNAVKYGRAPDGRSRVVLAAEHLGSEMRVTVADRGPGMSPEQLRRLFQPFERLGQEAGTQPGSGLGLVITRQLAQLLDAEVTLDSQPGMGTTATLRLPA